MQEKELKTYFQVKKFQVGILLFMMNLLKNRTEI